jgi:hypothetical protein
MKIRFFKLALAAVLLGGMISCVQEEPTRVPAKMDLENADELGKAALTFSNRAETKTVSFTADGDWYIRIPKGCDWLTVSPKEGTGDATVNFTTKAYEEESPRSATVAFVVDGLEQKATLDVTQLQKFHLNAEVATTVVPKTGGDVVIDITTNGTYTCTIDATGSSWLSVAEEGKNQIVLSAKPIAEGALKNAAKVTIACVEDEALAEVIDFSQKNLEISLGAKEIHSNGHAATGELTVTTINVENWSLTSSADWVTVEKTGNKVNFSLSENTTYADREATITVQCTDSEEDADVLSVVKVKQLVAADLVDYKFAEDGTAIDISPRANEIRSYTTNAAMNYYQEYASWGPSVSREINKTLNLSSEAVWLCNYTSFEDKINDGYTIESVFSIPTTHTNAETKAFGATKSGGFALMLGNTGAKTNTDGTKVTRDGSIEFIQHDGTNWTFAVTGVKPVPGQLYHVFGVWDGENFLCYVDGELKYSGVVKAIKHATQTPHHLAVAGNYNGETSFNGSWNGTVVAARMYDKALTPEQIKNKTDMKVNFAIVK